MKIEKTEIRDLLVIQPDVFKDDRGYFFESFSQKRYKELGIYFDFVQDNISKSQRNTLRGLHYQIGSSAQGKLCQVIVGKVLDVAVDIRFGSPTFGKYFSIILSGENNLQLWIPPGFAHGFAVLSDEAIFHYKCTSLYDKQSERTIRFDDPVLKIEWGISNPVLSEKDLRGTNFKDIKKDFIF
jgi:dTDP-4-dehydrorhamnose 3,5-epimerase